MADITASMVKELREATGIGMGDCRKALIEADGDIQLAKDNLRARGLAKAEKKAGRATKEGRLAINITDTEATIIEVLCETDFCSRNEGFVKMVDNVLTMAVAQPVGEIQATDEMTAAVQEAFATIGENMKFARGVKIQGTCIGNYIHHNNKVAVIVALDKEAPADAVAGLCQHITFSNPIGIIAEDIPAELIEKEKEIAIQQAVEQGKPQEIAEKMVVGKIRKFVADNALMEQKFIRDESQTIKQMLGGATVTAFARYAVGDTSE
ncbi:MAG: translation elongation factor Ts [Phycisphaerales bacterium]|jgi:elongation factor Ts|nr:translation elongation factor Ts [Phycisphaerales bacterium]MBT7171469.1 translation elongation factor Ts [Phycisphaerales bacterium]